MHLPQTETALSPIPIREKKSELIRIQVWFCIEKNPAPHDELFVSAFKLYLSLKKSWLVTVNNKILFVGDNKLLDDLKKGS